MAIRVAAGELRHVVRVEQKTDSRGTMGEVLESWTLFAWIRCKIWPGKGKEAEESRRETGTTSTRFYCRYYPGLTLAHRLIYKGRTFGITNIANIGELDRELEISAEETL